jgi:N-acetylglucosaminyl-diphospho-decaprenol L-rhamnosyltransferase
MAASFSLRGSLSIVIVTFNSAHTIENALASVRVHLAGAAILVVDNGSTDRTCEILESAADVQLIRGHGNIGFGAGVNLGAHHATTDLLFVMNPDAVVVKTASEQLRRLVQRPSVGIVGCRLSDRGGRDRRSVSTEWGWRRELWWSAMQWYLLPKEITVRRPRPRSADRLWVSGASFIVSRSEFLAIGGFDDAFFLYYEDVDLSRRYRQEGLDVEDSDALVVTHQQGASSGGDQPRVQTWALLSLVELVAKWYGQREAERLARTTLRLLGSIITLGRWAGRLPILAQRAGRKCGEVELVRLLLMASVDEPPTIRAYSQARSAIAAASTIGRHRYGADQHNRTGPNSPPTRPVSSCDQEPNR